MPMYEYAIPVGATNIEVIRRTLTYPIQKGYHTFIRDGLDGDSIILPLNGGDEAIGNNLEAQWNKGWDANISVFTAILSSGAIELGGLASVAGIGGAGWINSEHPVIQCHGTELTVAMESPTNDTGVTAARDIIFDFYLTKDKVVSNPVNENNFLRWTINVDEDGLLCGIYKEVDGTSTLLFTGSTYDDTTTRSNTADVVWIWRIVFNDGHAGESSPSDDKHMHVYVKTGSTLANAEAATENELTTSPYDLGNLIQEISFPSFRIYTEDDTNYFDATDEALVHYFRATHPGFDIRYNITEANRGKGDVAVWNGDPETASGLQVFDEDHEFYADCFVTNNLIKIQVDEAAQYGLKLEYHDGTAYDDPFNRISFTLVDDAVNLNYPYLQRIVKVSKDESIIRVALHEDASEDDDYFMIVDLTIRRGSYAMKLDIIEVYPRQAIEAHWTNSTSRRFAYAGDGQLSDDDANVDGLNTVLSDNLMLHLDNAQDDVVGSMFTNEKPAEGNLRFECLNGGGMTIDAIDWEDFEETSIWYAFTPYTPMTSLFKCGQSLVNEGGSDTATPGVGETCAAVLRLDAQNEGGHLFLAASALFPKGRYLAVYRDYCVGATQDYDIRAWNNSDSVYRNQENEWVTVTAQNNTWTFRFLLFDVTAADVSGADNMWIQAFQPNAGPNTIYIDYIMFIPYGDGESYPHDLAHAAMRAFSQPYRVFER